MDVFKAIQNRRTIRYYKDKKVALDDMLLLVEMGMKAPSAGNLQDFRFIVTREKKIIRKIIEDIIIKDLEEMAIIKKELI